MPSIAVATATSADRQYIMTPYFDSLAELKPDEVCLIDTTPDPLESIKFRNWLYEEAVKRELDTKLGYYIWDENYSKVRNMGLDMSESDWVLFLDSDEILSTETALGMRDKLESLPDDALVLRTYIISLLDDGHYFGRTWQKGFRPDSGTHGRIVRRGFGRWERKAHEIYNYPGRSDIPWDSPRHPKKDWFGSYILHLWFYKDAPMRRSDWSEHDFDVIPDGDDYVAVKNAIMKRRGWVTEEIPDGITWPKINWKIDKSQWRIK